CRQLWRQARATSFPPQGVHAMRPLVLTLRERPEQRLDLSPLTPQRLAGKSVAEIGPIALPTTRLRLAVRGAVPLPAGDAQSLRIENACDRLDRIGEGLNGGEILVEGDVGLRAGRLMTAGRLTVRGNAGPWAASRMGGGTIEITGNAGDHLGAPLAGE